MNWQTLIIEIVGAALSALGAWVLVKVKTLINTKIKNAKVREILDGATSIVSSAVKATYQTYVEAIKGTDLWTAEAQALALQKATEAAKAQLTAEAQTYIGEQYGNVETWLKTQIESVLYDLKNTTDT